MEITLQSLINVALAIATLGGLALNFRKQARTESAETHTVLAADYKRLVEERAELRIENERLHHLTDRLGNGPEDVADLEARLAEAQTAASQYRRERDTLQDELRRTNARRNSANLKGDSHDH